jgi:hypothetical protein
MKKIFLLIICIYSSTIFAQTIKKNSLSFNLTYPTVQLLQRNTPDTLSTTIPTNLNYAHIFKNKYLLRIGAGGYTNYQISNSDLVTDKVASNYKKITGVISFYKLHLGENEKWLFGIGGSLNAIYNKNQRFFDSGVDVVEFYNYANGVGFGPSFFARYNFSKSISFYTDYSLYYNFYTTANGKKFSALPEQNYKSKNILNHGIQFQYPVSIHLEYSF